MIVLNENMGVDIPNYDDLDNKPKINGVTLEGDLTSAELGIDLDTTRYYTKTQSDNRFQPKGDYQPAGNYQPVGNYLTSIPSEYVTENELNNTLNQKDYATKTYVDNAIDNVEAGNVDLSDYYTKDEVDNLIDNVEVDLTDYYTKGEVDNLIDNVDVDLTGYATEQWVENKGYLTAVPSAYVTETELNSTLTNKNYATKSEIPTIPTNVSAFNNDAGYITENALNGYASENWVTENYQPKGDYQPAGNYLTSIPSEYVTETYISENYQPKGDYLTSIPSEYITETELNEALAGLDGTDIPYVCILLNQNGIKEYVGDLQAVIEAVKNKTPYLAYARTFEDPNNYGTDLGPSRTTIPLTATYNNNEGSSGYKTGNFGYHTELGGDSLHPHLDVKINFKYDNTTESYILTTISKVTHTYLTHNYYDNYLAPAKQDKLVSGTNIKTINGISILGSGDLTIGSSDNNGIAYLKVNYDETNGYSYDGSFADVANAITNNKPYIIYVPADIASYYTTIETARYQRNNENEQITGVSYTHTGVEHYFTYWYLLEDATFIHKTVNVKIYQNELVSGTNIKTINNESILGSGNIEISGGTTDLSNYYTKTEIDTQIGDINTILENIIG